MVSGPRPGARLIAHGVEADAVGLREVDDDERPLAEDVSPRDRLGTGLLVRGLEVGGDQVVGVDAVFVRLPDAVLRPVLDAFGACAPPVPWAASAVASMILSAVSRPSTQ